MGFLIDILDPIGSILGSVLGTVWNVISGFISVVGGFIVKYIIEPIMNFLGFVDEDIYMTDVIAVKVYSDDDLLKKIQLELVTEFMKKDTGAKNYAMGFANTGDSQFGKFYRHGKWDYIDYLPSVQVNASVLPTDKVKDILKAKIGADVFIIDILAMVPYDKDWCKWLLQEHYSYDIGEDFAIINDRYYTLNSVVYVSSTNKFKTTLAPISTVNEKIYNNIINIAYRAATITTDVYKITEITISSNIKHTKIINRTIKIHNESNYELSSIDTIISEVDEPTTETGNSTVQELITSTETNDKDVQQVTIVNDTRYYRIDTGSLLTKSESTISDVYSIVNLNTAITSNNIVLIGSTDINTGNTDNLVLMLDNHNNVRRYNISYTNVDTGRLHYWIYDPTTNQYPELTNAVSRTENLESYPIVMLRNSFFNVGDYNSSSINGVSRPPSVTKQRYDNTNTLLNYLGISLESLTEAYSGNPDINKLQDAFFLFGVSPSDTNEVVSKVLYEMFDAIYDKMPYISGGTTYSASFKENPYNAAIVWQPQLTSIKLEKIGYIGKCTHTIRNNPVTKTRNKVQTVIDYGSYKYITRYYQDILSDSFGTTISISNTDVTSMSIIDDYDEYTNGTQITTESVTVEPNKDLVIKKQITSTETKTLSCNSFTSFNIIRRGVSNGGVSLDLDNPNLVIPLPVDVVNRLTLMDKTSLLGSAAYMMFYAYEHKHIKWYQTAAFNSFLKIIAIAISVIVTIISLGSASWASMTWTAAVMSALKAVAVGLALQLALKLIMDNVSDPALKAALAVVATATAIYVGGGFNKFDGLTALRLVELPMQASEIYMNSINKQAIGNLNKDIGSFSTIYKSRTEQNKELMKGFNSGLNVGNIAELMVTPSNDDGGIAMSLSPTQFFDLSITSYRNYDWLYSGLYDSTVHDFCKNKLSLGITPDGD